MLPRSARLATATVALGLVAACTGSPTPAPPSSAATPLTPVAYAAHALDLIGSGLDVDETTWPDVRANALERAAKFPTTAGTYDALRDALAAAGQRRADLVAPADMAKVPPSSAEPSTTTSEGISVVTLPGFVDLSARPGSGEATDAEKSYARGGSAAIANAARMTTCGWVVDVRRNSSTDVPVLVGSIASLLPRGTALVDTDRSGGTVDLAVTDSAVTFAGRSVLPLDPVDRHDQPVVVLQDSGTHGAGEAVVLAFRGRDRTTSIGQPTFGDATDGTTEPLSDGAALVVTRWRMGDRTGAGPSTVSPLAPDQLVDGDDAQLLAARDWLASQCP